MNEWMHKSRALTMQQCYVKRVSVVIKRLQNTTHHESLSSLESSRNNVNSSNNNDNKTNAARVDRFLPNFIKRGKKVRAVLTQKKPSLPKSIEST
jgi:hypothetical protein